MKVFTKIQFIYLIIFIFLLSFSKQLVSFYYDQPIKNNLHQNFHKFVINLKSDFNEKNLIRSNSKNICEEVSAGNINRHSLRWILEKFRILVFDINFKIFKNLKANTYLFSLTISIFLFCVFINLKNYGLKKHNLNKISDILLIFLIFIFFVTLFFSRPIGEIRFSIFEILFISLSLHYSLNKKYFLYLLSVILCSLNRESGILCAIIWPLINNIKLPVENFKLLILNQVNFKNLLPLIFSVVFIILFNFDIASCFFEGSFFIPHDISNTTLLENNFLKLNLSNINGLFVNYFVIIFVLIVFYKKTEIQQKLIFLILTYLVVFLFFTPLIQYEIRVVLTPFIVIYIIEYVAKLKSYSQIK